MNCRFTKLTSISSVIIFILAEKSLKYVFFLNADNLQYNRSLFDFLKTSFHIFEAVNRSKSH